MSVYFIQAGGEQGDVKIGVAIKPWERLKELQTGNPKPLTILRGLRGGYQLEAELHDTFARHRLHGEWFSFDRRMLTIARSLELPPGEFREECANCGEYLKNERPFDEYCSEICTREAAKLHKPTLTEFELIDARFQRCPSKVCQCCDNTFVPKTNHQRFCSLNCAYRSRQPTNQSKPQSKLSNIIHLTNCSYCDNPFRRQHLGTLYCSPRCKRLAAVERKVVREDTFLNGDAEYLLSNRGT